MNDIRMSVFRSQKELENYRLYIGQDQLQQFWENKSFIEMENILTISDPYVLETVTYFLSYMLNQKRALETEAYEVVRTKQKQTVLSVYDCKIFKSSTNQKSDNQFISSLMIVYNHVMKNQLLPKNLNEIIDPSILFNKHSLIKVKASCILRIYSIIELMQQLDTEIVIIPKPYYITYMNIWLTQTCYMYPSQFVMISMFKTLLHLMQNQIFLQFFQSLTPQERHHRQYSNPIKRIKKPKQKQQGTITERVLGQVQWHTLKIEAYRLKYRVQQQKQQILCFRPPKQNQQDNEDFLSDINADDMNILACFEKARGNDYY